ncbi:AraC family transcriptional regulator [Maritalea mediterranea]|uniref:AraC family transcriptional regulator n=1 Tax=Maritalea mediterranea TaxID=2909667 RepID=A0ABS9E7Q5_9HYPH|nr:AraC family transcriptional regulator [Maritalea mediterranea]MCF4098918.1 AraC family transcriptional regulator [Maritalea mediterranea]
MDLQTQETATATELFSGERAKFWREARHCDLECLTATFRTHTYAPHTHDTFVIGAIVSGQQQHKLKGNESIGGPGSVFMLNPEEVHDGRPMAGGYSYRMLYPSVELMHKVARDLPGVAPGRGSLFFKQLMVQDDTLAEHLLRLHAQLEQSLDPLEKDEAIYLALGQVIGRYGSWRKEPVVGRAPKAVRDMCDYMRAHYDEEVDLDQLCALSGMSKSYLVRVFAKHMGQTPHSFLTDVRVRQARAQLAQGVEPTQVAFDCGFYDQSHLNRHFKKRIGVAPGAYRNIA